MAQKNLKDTIVAALEQKIATTVNRKPGNAAFRKAATQKHLNAIRAYPNPIYTMNNVDIIYDDADLKRNTSEGKPYAIVEDIVMKETVMPTKSMREVPQPNKYKSFYYPEKSIAKSIKQRPYRNTRRSTYRNTHRNTHRSTYRSPYRSTYRNRYRLKNRNVSIRKRNSWRKPRPNSPWPKNVTRKNIVPKLTKPLISKPVSTTQKKKDYKKQIITKLMKEQKKEKGSDIKIIQRHIDAIKKYPGKIYTVEDVDKIYQLARLSKDKPYKMIASAFKKKETRQKKMPVFQPSSFMI